MRVLHMVASLAAEWGGPPKVVSPLVDGLARRGVECSIFSPDSPRTQSLISPEKGEVSLFRPGWLSRWWKGYSPELARAVERAVPEFDLIHLHELWHFPHFAGYRAAQRRKRPYVITPHGALEPWALNHEGAKKFLYLNLLQRRMLKKAAALQAFTQSEIASIRKVCPQVPVMRIPNGVRLEDFRNLPPGEWWEKSHPEMKGKKMVLFLGRIHPVKGLDVLGKAFARVRHALEDVFLVIAGPDEDAYREKVERLIRAEGIQDRTIFPGMLTGEAKLAALARADLFVLPSYSEGFSMAILEALSCKVPVVITPQCHFPEVRDAGAGEIVDPEDGPLAAAMERLLRDDGRRVSMGEKGRRLVGERFTWERVAEQMLAFYEAVLDQHDRKASSTENESAKEQGIDGWAPWHDEKGAAPRPVPQGFPLGPDSERIGSHL